MSDKKLEALRAKASQRSWEQAVNRPYTSSPEFIHRESAPIARSRGREAAVKYLKKKGKMVGKGLVRKKIGKTPIGRAALAGARLAEKFFQK